MIFKLNFGLFQVSEAGLEGMNAVSPLFLPDQKLVPGEYVSIARQVFNRDGDDEGCLSAINRKFRYPEFHPGVLVLYSVQITQYPVIERQAE